MTLIRLESNQPPNRFYRGGEKIRLFRGAAAAGDRVPEDWVASTTQLFGESMGHTVLEDGVVLRDAVAHDSDYWLGSEHMARFGADTMLLVKILDAGQRLPVHIHPDREFAEQHLGHSHGKAEAWYILEGGTVYLGFTRDITESELRSWVSGQNVPEMIGAMHPITVQAGDSVYVPPGTPHAIGDGVFLVEVQEPEDLSILLEWNGFAIDGPAQGHLGLGFDTALDATDRHGWTVDAITALVVRQGQGTGTLPKESALYFRAERFEVAQNEVLDLEPGFCVIVVLEGAGSLAPATGASIQVTGGTTILVPNAAGNIHATGNLRVLVCRPPKH
jgi:mannose-6-phosphate isomerase